VYTRPASPFVARFVGHMNFIPAEACGAPGRARAGAVELAHAGGDGGHAPGTPLTLAIRPEEIAVGPGARGGENAVAARVEAVQFLGAFTRLTLSLPALGEARLTCDVAATAFADLGTGEGREVAVRLGRDALRVFAGRG
jgi:iron(III) transport system ATP-binding protein